MNPYPYKILPVVCPTQTDAEALDPWFVLEFFRVEALLRSNKVTKLYAQDMEAGCLGHLDNTSYFTEPYWALTREDAKNDSLHKGYKVAGGWLTLKGMHHKYLSPEQTERLFAKRGRPIHAESVININEELAPGLRLGKEPFEVLLKLFQINLELDMEKSGGKRFLWLRVDTAFPPQTIIRILKPQLETLHRNIGEVEWEQTGPAIFHPKRRPLIQGYTGIKKWFDCLTCYDLRTRDGLSFSKIATQLYGTRTDQTYERAERSYKRFNQLIVAAESDNWPPKGIK